MAKLSFDTGKKSYEIEEKGTGKILCTIDINTTDLNMMKRLMDMPEKVRGAIPDKDSFTSNEEAIEFINKADKSIREIIDEAFDAKICDKLFQNTNCLSFATDGTIPVERFLKMITPVIVSDYEQAIKESEKKIKKYTDQVK